LGRSLKHLVEVLEIIRDTGTGLYIHTQSVDTTTPAGRVFGMLGIFSEFEREMIVARVNAGLARAKEAIARNGEFRSKAGKIRKRLGRPNADPKIEAARASSPRAQAYSRRPRSQASDPDRAAPQDGRETPTAMTRVAVRDGGKQTCRQH
jgi:Resolvase, N terminal domain